MPNDLTMATAASSTSASPSRQLSVVDVYDLAAAVGRDFEQLIDAHGTDTVRTLMPKVISALEMLEAFAANNDRDNETIISLTRQLDRATAAKTDAASARDRYEQEIETQDELHRAEVDKLSGIIKMMQMENRRLQQMTDEGDVGYSTGGKC